MRKSSIRVSVMSHRFLLGSFQPLSSASVPPALVMYKCRQPSKHGSDHAVLEVLLELGYSYHVDHYRVEHSV